MQTAHLTLVPNLIFMARTSNKSPDFPGEEERGSGVHSTPFLGGGRQNFLETRTSAKKRLHSLGDISSGSPKAGYPSY